MHTVHIPYYLDYLSEAMLIHQWGQGEPIGAVPGLRVAPGLRSQFPTVETDDALRFVVELYTANREHLGRVLAQRSIDRAFIDRVTAACAKRNSGTEFQSADYETVIGRVDEAGRVVVGPNDAEFSSPGPVEIPAFMEGDQVTLFGESAGSERSVVS